MITLLFFLLILLESNAQDLQSSQFLANPLYHNPAFTGSSGFSRVSVNHRSQYVSLGDFAAYNTQIASFDTFFENLNSGIGFQVTHDIQGKGFTTNKGALYYSYSRYWDANDITTKKLNGVSLGIQLSYQNNIIGGEDLKFVYQYTSNGFDNTVSSSSTNALYNYSMIDFSVGAIYSTRGKHDINESAFIAGLAIHHFATNNMKYTVHLSKTIPLSIDNDRDESTLSFTGYYRRQNGNQQVDIGMNWVKSPLMVGIWYRGMPFLNNNGAIQSDAIYVVGGWQWDNFRLTGSYDIPLSSLISSGSFEITLGIILSNGFRFGDHSSKDKASKCTNHGYQWLF
jgi:type IX secretion system PorP/SprF family membrane protein